jgi:hypothetical protein
MHVEVIVAAYLFPTSSAQASHFRAPRSTIARLAAATSHTFRHKKPHRQALPFNASTLSAIATSTHPLRLHHPTSTPDRPISTAKMVAMYTIAGRQVGSHVVRPPVSQVVVEEKFESRFWKSRVEAMAPA